MGDRGGLLSQIQAGKKLKTTGGAPPPASPGRVVGGPTAPPRGGPSKPASMAPSKPSSPALPSLPPVSKPPAGPSKPLPALPSAPTKPLPPSPVGGLPGPTRPSGRPIMVTSAEEGSSPSPRAPMRPPVGRPHLSEDEPHAPISPMRPPGRAMNWEESSLPRGPPFRPPGQHLSEDEFSPSTPVRLPGPTAPSRPLPSCDVSSSGTPRERAKTVVPATVGKEFEERLKYNFPAAEMQVDAGLYVIRRFASYISKLCKAMQIYYSSVDEATKKEVGLGGEFQKDGCTDHVTAILFFETIMTENSKKMHQFASLILVDVVVPLQNCHTSSSVQLKSISEQFQLLYKPFLPLQRLQRRCVELHDEMEGAKTEALKNQLKVKLDAEAAKYENMKLSLSAQASSFHASTQPLLASLQQMEQNRLYVLQQALGKLSEQCLLFEHLGGVSNFRDTISQLSEAKALDAWTGGVTKYLDQNYVSQSNPSGPPVADWPLVDNTSYRLTHRATISAGASMRHLWGSVKSGVVDAVESVKHVKGSGGDSSAPSAPTAPDNIALDTASVPASPSSPRNAVGRPPMAPAAPEPPLNPPTSPPLSPGPPMMRGPGRSLGPSAPPRKPATHVVVGQYDYPGTGDPSYDLLFSEGDRIELLTPASVDWDAVAAGEVVWCTGKLISSGQEGEFPASFVALE